MEHAFHRPYQPFVQKYWKLVPLACSVVSTFLSFFATFDLDLPLIQLEFLY